MVLVMCHYYVHFTILLTIMLMFFIVCFNPNSFSGCPVCLLMVCGSHAHAFMPMLMPLLVLMLRSSFSWHKHLTFRSLHDMQKYLGSVCCFRLPSLNQSSSCLRMRIRTHMLRNIILFLFLHPFSWARHPI